MPQLCERDSELHELARQLQLCLRMNQDIASGKWKQLKGEVKQKWGKLTDDDVDRVDGRRDDLVGKLQEKYGHTREAAEKEVSEFFGKLSS